MPTPTRSEAAPGAPDGDELLARAVVCRALRLGLEPPASPDALDAAPGAAALRHACSRLEGEASGELAAAAEGWLAGRGRPGNEGRREHERLFGHTLRGQVCPYECEYGPSGPLQQAHALSDLSGFYRAFGLRPARGRHERPDHVACELEFYGFLALKERFAASRGDAETAEAVRRAARGFLREHLARFGMAFARSLRQAAGEASAYRRLAVLFEAFLLGECRRQGVPPGPDLLELRPDEPDGLPMACGDGGSPLVQIGGDAAPPRSSET